jgi:biopolymer transport protein ExbB/TolQ
VAVIALWCYNFLNTRVEIIGAEMSNTASEVIDFFVRKETQKGGV